MSSNRAVRRAFARSPWRRPWRSLLLAALGLGSALAPWPATAAETLTLAYEPFRLEVALADLQQWSKTGVLPRDLEPYQPFFKPEQVQSAGELLDRPLPVDATAIVEFLGLPEGSYLLNRIAALFSIEESAETNLTPNPEPESSGPDASPDSAKSPVQMLRRTLIQAAKDEGGLSLINVVRQFPAENLELDVAVALKLVADNAALYGRRSQVADALRIQAALEAQRLAAPSSTVLNQMPTDFTQAGPHAWQKQSLTVPASRPEAGFSAEFPLDLYIPELNLPELNLPEPGPAPNPESGAATGPLPLLIISHGLGSDRQSLAYLAEHFASYGFAVAVPEHTQTSYDRFTELLQGMADPPPASELLNRPGEITRSLDFLEAQAKAEPALAQLNLSEVGILGQSLGGYTALAAAGAEIDRARLAKSCPQGKTVSESLTLNLSLPIQCRILELPESTSLEVRDPRIQAVMALNPLTSQIFGPRGMAKLRVPVMILGGTDDYFTPALAEQVEPFGWLRGGSKYLLLTKAGTHFSFLAAAQDKANSLPQLIGPDPAPAQLMLRAISVAFFSRSLRDDRQAAVYLTQHYLELLRQDPFEFSLVRSLPERMPEVGSR